MKNDDAILFDSPKSNDFERQVFDYLRNNLTLNVTVSHRGSVVVAVYLKDPTTNEPVEIASAVDYL